MDTKWIVILQNCVTNIAFWYSPLNHQPSQLEKHVPFCYSVKLLDKYRILIFSLEPLTIATWKICPILLFCEIMWQISHFDILLGGQSALLTFFTRKFLLIYRGKKGARKKGKMGRKNRKTWKGRGRGGRLKMKGKNGWKWVEDPLF